VCSNLTGSAHQLSRGSRNHCMVRMLLFQYLRSECRIANNHSSFRPHQDLTYEHLLPEGVGRNLHSPALLQGKLNVTSFCILITSYKHFGRSCCLYLQGKRMNCCAILHGVLVQQNYIFNSLFFVLFTVMTGKKCHFAWPRFAVLYRI
jgi:hypothetical protein